MWLAPSSVVDSAVDYITCTSGFQDESKLMLLKAEQLIDSEFRAGNDVKPWGMKGYKGWRCGRVEYGWRHDGAIVRLSSGLAANYWYDIYQFARRVSRVDVQCTLKCEGAVNLEIAEIRKQVSTFFQGRTDGPRITWWSDSLGGATVYLGSRQSGLYFRGYNKAVQSQDEAFTDCLRCELEVKSVYLPCLMAQLTSGELVSDVIRGVLSGFLNERGVSSKFESADPRLLSRCPTVVTDRVKQLRWLRECVSPTVKKLIDSGSQDEVLLALGVLDQSSSEV